MTTRMSEAPAPTPAISERTTLLWRLWVAPERERAPARPLRRPVTTWGTRERRLRGRVRVVG